MRGKRERRKEGNKEADLTLTGITADVSDDPKDLNDIISSFSIYLRERKEGGNL